MEGGGCNRFSCETVGCLYLNHLLVLLELCTVSGGLANSLLHNVELLNEQSCWQPLIKWFKTLQEVEYISPRRTGVFSDHP